MVSELEKHLEGNSTKNCKEYSFNEIKNLFPLSRFFWYVENSHRTNYGYRAGKIYSYKRQRYVGVCVIFDSLDYNNIYFSITDNLSLCDRYYAIERPERSKWILTKYCVSTNRFKPTLT